MPNNWKTYKLEEISTNVAYGYTASASIENVGPKFLRITDIQDNFINWESVPFCKIKENDFKKNKLEIGDIVVARTGNSTGATACIKDEIDAVFASYLIRFRIDKEVANPFYIDFILRSQNWKNYVEAVKGGSAQPGANAKQFGAFELELPPLPEQKSIASILSAIDDKIENNLAINKTLEEMAMALYKHWFVDFGPFQDGEFIESELGMIPKGWEVKKLGDLYDTTSGGTPSRTKMDYYENGTIQWIKSKELDNTFIIDTEEKITEIALSKSSAKRFPAKSVLIAMYGATVGEIAINSEVATCNQAICAIKQINLPYFYVFLFLKNEKENILNQAVGSAQQNISQIIIKNLQLLNPNIEDVKELFNELDAIFNKLEENIKENQTLTQLRDTLLPKLISGEVRLKEFRESITN